MEKAKATKPTKSMFQCEQKDCSKPDTFWKRTKGPQQQNCNTCQKDINNLDNGIVMVQDTPQGRKFSKRACHHCDVLKVKRGFSDGAWVAPPKDCICKKCLTEAPILKQQLAQQQQQIYKREQQQIQQEKQAAQQRIQQAQAQEGMQASQLQSMNAEMQRQQQESEMKMRQMEAQLEAAKKGQASLSDINGAGYANPMAMGQAPMQMMGMQQPMMGMQQPMMGMQLPMMGGMQQPMMGMQQPLMQQPGYGQPQMMAQPGYGQPHMMAQPGYGQPHMMAQPGYGQPMMPGVGQPMPGIGQPMPGYGQQMSQPPQMGQPFGANGAYAAQYQNQQGRF